MLCWLEVSVGLWFAVGMGEEGILSIADFDFRAEAVKLRVRESLRLSVVEIGREWAAEIHPAVSLD